MTTTEPAPVQVSRAQVRAARELIRLRGVDRVHPLVRQIASLPAPRLIEGATPPAPAA